MRCKHVIFAIILGLMFTGWHVDAMNEVGESKYPTISTPTPCPLPTAGQSLLWSHTIHEPGATWLKIHFSNVHLNPGDFVKIIDQYGMTVETFSGKEIAGRSHPRIRIKPKYGDSNSFWLHAFAGEELRVEVHCDAAALKTPGHMFTKGKNKDLIERKSWSLKIDEVGVGAKTLSYDELMMMGYEDISMLHTICQANDLLNMACFSGTTYFDRGEAVGYMMYEIYGYWYFGTGFLVACNSSNHFLTTYNHISPSVDIDDIDVWFNYQYPYCNGTGTIIMGITTVDELVKYDSGLNFSLLRLDDNPFNATPLEPLNREPVVDEQIYIIQHPNDKKKIGFGTVYTTTAAGGLDFTYYIDTLYQSTGAPILNAVEHKVLGWDYSGNCPNKGIKMKKIYDLIKPYTGCQ